jgi:tetratricopeptide (TPR) repeat protein
LKSIRYLTAAVAARPRSAMARLALGMSLFEQRNDDPQAFRLLRGAATIDPTSPWPHLMLGYTAMETGNGKDMLGAFREAVRVDPEVSFFMILSTLQFDFAPQSAKAKRNITPDDLARFYDDLIAMQPNQAGGYVLRGGFRHQNGDYRSALADYRKALPLASNDDPFRAIAKGTLQNLEAIARWEDKLPAILKGEFRPANAFQLLEVAEYCAEFEKKNVLAVRFATDAIAADSKLYLQFNKVPEMGRWAIKAATGAGIDAVNLSEVERSQLRKKALTWFKESQAKLDKGLVTLLAEQLWNDPVLSHVRDKEEIAKLPPDEQAEWNRFWNELPKKKEKLEVAPPPRTVKFR